jgi:magnesium transporter
MILLHPSEKLGAATWIDLLAPTAEEIEQVRQATGLRVPTESDISEIESSSRLMFENDAYYVSTPLVAPRGEDELMLSPVGFVLSSRVLITVRFAPIRSFDAAHDAFVAQSRRTAEEALLRIFEVVVDRSADKLERAGAQCDELSRNAFRSAARGWVSGDLRAALRRVGNVADRTSHMREALLGIGRIAAFLMESGIEGAPPVSAARMKAVRGDVTSLTDYQAHLSAKVQFLLDATLGFINIEQNEIVKTLTIASVAGIPPVLVVGIYGMNFRVMPELSWPFGYQMAIVLVVVSALIPVVCFKRRGWI